MLQEVGVDEANLEDLSNRNMSRQPKARISHWVGYNLGEIQVSSRLGGLGDWRGYG